MSPVKKMSKLNIEAHGIMYSESIRRNFVIKDGKGEGQTHKVDMHS